MSLTGKTFLALLAAVAIILFVPPILGLIAILSGIVGLFGLVVALWAIVRLGERWVDEGLGGYNYLDALDDSLQDVFQGLRGAFVKRKGPTLRQRAFAAVRASLPLYGARLRVIVGVLALPVLIVLDVVRYGCRETRKDLKGLGGSIGRAWNGYYL